MADHAPIPSGSDTGPPLADRDSAPSQREWQIAPEQYDAIHRALLAGLLGNIGHKTGEHEYTAARGTKFNLFPGSTLFRKTPAWVMAAEVVETTRLYARTAARIRPEWVERVAAHLVKRTYSEPHWSVERASVVAYERVTLYGLPVVARRAVHYGPIDPRTSRELFIRHALVEGEYRTDAQYFRKNRDLVREIELLEAKLRRRDVLVDAATRFAFYDARVPSGIYSGRLFERWRREAERDDPRVLLMTRADLMLHAAEQATPGLFPDAIAVNGVRLRLDYRLDPGHPNDGITATVPLAALNQIPAEPFEWLVPGMLREKVAALIKTLPKPLRVRFVPAPDFANAAVAEMKRGGNLLDALGAYLGMRAGIEIPRQAWQPDELAAHLLMNFKVVDASGRQLAVGRNLSELRGKLGEQVKSSFADLPESTFNRARVASWDFGDLPERVPMTRDGMTLFAYPALVDEGESVALRLHESPEAAREAMRGGVRRLLMLQMREEVKYLSRHLPGIEQMCLHYAPLGSCDELKQDLLASAADRALFGDDAADVRTREQFEELAGGAWRRFSEAASEVCDAGAQALSNYHAVANHLSGRFPPLLADAVRDMREQLSRLVPRRFVARTPYPWLQHLPRYLKAIGIRLQKLLNSGLARDAQAAQQVLPLWEAYLDRAEKHRKKGVLDPALEHYRWMLEELRVSLFAQELKTSMPVSPKRLAAQWEKVKPE